MLLPLSYNNYVILETNFYVSHHTYSIVSSDACSLCQTADMVCNLYHYATCGGICMHTTSRCFMHDPSSRMLMAEWRAFAASCMLHGDGLA